VIAPLAPAAILAAWEQGRDQHPVNRALVLLGAAAPGLAGDALARLTVGERDRRLLDLRRATFGDRMESWATCARCGDAIEFAVSAGGLRVAPADGRPAETAELRADGLWLRVRAPNSLDLAAVADAPDAGAARARLLARCATVVTPDGAGGAPLDVAGAPPAVLDQVETALAGLDPQADVILALECPACGHAWDLVFDIAEFLWQEIAAAAVRLAGEVHALARAYGWREPDILALSPARRQLYLSLVG
jgi:hypothetical protein